MSVRAPDDGRCDQATLVGAMADGPSVRGPAADSKRYKEAEDAYRAELKNHPRNGWSLLGLQQALAGQGVTLPDVDAEFAASWARSDTWIRSSRF